MKIPFILILLMLVAHLAFSQNKLWIGTNAAVNYDHYQINDPGGQLSEKPAVAWLFGFNVEKEFSNIFTFGTGIHFKTYMARAKNMNSTIYETSFNSLQIPIYLKAGKYFNNRLFKLNLITGGNYVINVNYGKKYYGTGGSSFSGFSSFVFNSFEVNGNLKQSFFLLHGGGGIAFTIFKKCKLELNVIRHIGFSEVTKVDVNYSINGSEAPPAMMISKGSFTVTSLQFFHPLNTLKNKDSN